MGGSIFTINLEVRIFKKKSKKRRKKKSLLNNLASKKVAVPFLHTFGIFISMLHRPL